MRAGRLPELGYGLAFLLSLSSPVSGAFDCKAETVTRIAGEGGPHGKGVRIAWFEAHIRLDAQSSEPVEMNACAKTLFDGGLRREAELLLDADEVFVGFLFGEKTTGGQLASNTHRAAFRKSTDEWQFVEIGTRR